MHLCVSVCAVAAAAAMGNGICTQSDAVPATSKGSPNGRVSVEKGTDGKAVNKQLALVAEEGSLDSASGERLGWVGGWLAVSGHGWGRRGGEEKGRDLSC